MSSGRRAPVGPDRRAFLKRTGAALSAAAASGCVPDAPSRGARGAAGGEGGGRSLDEALLRAVAGVVLPAELGDGGRARAVAAFRAWAAAYEPVAELDHGYGTHVLRYGPADPVPGWGAQLRALELEASRRHGAGFTAVESAERRALVAAAMAADGGEALPDPLRARHVATALLAHWFRSADAVDRCYRRRVGPRTCRGLDDSAVEPEALG